MISNSLFSGIADRIAAQVLQFKVGINSGMNTGTPNYKRIHTGLNGPDGDYEIENALINAAHAVDTNTISGTMFKNLYTAFLNAIETHVLDNDAEDFDSWLDTSGINVHPEFEDAWYQVKGSHLDAVNVFYPHDNLLVASTFPTASGTSTYTAGTPLGTGTGKLSSTNYAAGKFVLVPVGTVGSETIINLRLLKESGQSSGSTADSCNIRVPNATTSGTQFPINWELSGINSSNMYLDCNNIVTLGGTSGNGFRVYAIKERTVRL